MIVAVGIVAVIFGFHYISELIVSEIVVDSIVIEPTTYFEYCQKMNLDC